MPTPNTKELELAEQYLKLSATRGITKESLARLLAGYREDVQASKGNGRTRLREVEDPYMPRGAYGVTDTAFIVPPKQEGAEPDGEVTNADILTAIRLWRDVTGQELYASAVMPVAQVLLYHRAEILAQQRRTRT